MNVRFNFLLLWENIISLDIASNFIFCLGLKLYVFTTYDYDVYRALFRVNCIIRENGKEIVICRIIF